MTEESNEEQPKSFPRYQPDEINIKEYVERLRDLQLHEAEKRISEKEIETKKISNKTKEYVLVKNEGVAMVKNIISLYRELFRVGSVIQFWILKKARFLLNVKTAVELTIFR